MWGEVFVGLPKRVSLGMSWGSSAETGTAAMKAMTKAVTNIVIIPVVFIRSSFRKRHTFYSQCHARTVSVDVAAGGTKAYTARKRESCSFRALPIPEMHVSAGRIQSRPAPPRAPSFDIF